MHHWQSSKHRRISPHSLRLCGPPVWCSHDDTARASCSPVPTPSDGCVRGDVQAGSVPVFVCVRDLIRGTIYCLAWPLLNLSIHSPACEWPGLDCVTGLRDVDMFTLSECGSPAAKSSPTVSALTEIPKIQSRALWNQRFPLQPVTAVLPCLTAPPVRHMAFGVPGGSSNMTYFVLCGGGLTAAVVYVSVPFLAAPLLNIESFLLVASTSHTSSQKESKILKVAMTVCIDCEYANLLTKLFVWPIKCHSSEFLQLCIFRVHITHSPKGKINLCRHGRCHLCWSLAKCFECVLLYQ